MRGIAGGCDPQLSTSSERLAAIPFHRVGHRGLELVQVRGGAPADVVMLGGGESVSVPFLGRAQ